MKREPRLSAGIVLAYGDIYTGNGWGDRLVEPHDLALLRFNKIRTSMWIRDKPVLVAASAGSQRINPSKPIARVGLATQLRNYACTREDDRVVAFKIGEPCWGTMAEIRNSVTAILDPQVKITLPIGKDDDSWPHPEPNHFMDFFIAADNELHAKRIAWACWAQHRNERHDFKIINMNLPMSPVRWAYEKIKLPLYIKDALAVAELRQGKLEVPPGLQDWMIRP